MHAGYTVFMWRMEQGVFSVPATQGTVCVCGVNKGVWHITNKCTNSVDRNTQGCVAYHHYE